MKTLKKLNDGDKFKLSKRSKVVYELNSKKKGIATFTSLSSKMTFTRQVTTNCYPV